MNSRSLALRIAGTAFGVFALAHVARLVTHTDVHVGEHEVPLAGSIVGAAIGAALSAWMLELSCEES
ncbi:MAG: hypothetical protein ACJ8HQ_05745 [Chthoniobacterales bacterium]